MGKKTGIGKLFGRMLIGAAALFLFRYFKKAGKTSAKRDNCMEG
mgnify:CR=1 FL=1